MPFLYGSAPGLRVAGAGHVVGTRSPQTPTHRSSSEPASSKRPSPMGRLAASLPRLGGVGEPGAPSRATSSTSEPGGPSSELGLGAWPRPAAAARMAARAAICARCIRALSGSLSSSRVALVRAGGSEGGGGCRASSSWRARCCRCRSVSITACSFMALRAGPPRAPGGGGGGGPCGEGARPHCSVGAAGEPGQCRVARGRGRRCWAQAEGWRGMPVAGGQHLLSHTGHQGVAAAGGWLIHVYRNLGVTRDRQIAPGLLPTEVRPQRPLGKSLPSTIIRVQTWGPPWRWRSMLAPSSPLHPPSSRLRSWVTLYWTPEGLEAAPTRLGHRETTPPRKSWIMAS